MRRLKHERYEGRLSELGWLKPEEVIKGNLLTIFKYAREGYGEAGASFFSKAWSSRTRSNRQVTKRKLQLDKENNSH